MLPLFVVCFYEKWEKMGRKSIGDMAGIEKAIDDIRHGRVTEYIRHLHERTPYNNLSILLINKA